jgi:hypothetical protein
LAPTTVERRENAPTAGKYVKKLHFSLLLTVFSWLLTFFMTFDGFSQFLQFFAGFDGFWNKSHEKNPSKVTNFIKSRKKVVMINWQKL